MTLRLSKISVFLTLLVFMLSLDTSTAETINGYTFYLPLVYQQPYPCGVEVWRGFGYTNQLADLNCRYTRYNPGTENSPNLYRTWLTNNKNWSSLDFAETDIAKIRAARTEPVIVFFGNHDGTCTRLSVLRYQEFTNFVRSAVGRWNLRYIEIWNEPDYLDGHPNLYGCWGIEYTSQLVQLLRMVTATVWSTHPNVSVGTSFTYESHSPGMMQAVAAEFQNEARFILGFHHYGIYGMLSDPTIEQQVDIIRTFWPGRLWLTETNIRKWSSDGMCHDPDNGLRQAQAELIMDAQEIRELDTMIAFGLSTYSSSWQCTALLENDWSPNPAYQALNNNWHYP